MLPKNNDDVDNIFTVGTVSTFRYTNHKGETSMRKVIFLCLRYDSTEYHKERQWLMECFDIDKKDYRTFALAGIDPR